MIPRDYQRVINPWMNASEIRRGIVFVDRLLARLKREVRHTSTFEAERRELLGLDRPPRNWSRQR